MIPKELQQIINNLDDQLGYMQGALNHIEIWTSKYQKNNNLKPDVPLDYSANTLHSDLIDGINLVKKLCRKYSNISNDLENQTIGEKQ
jgi:hypothetical protein